ncbi:response regulator transcription factor, partial [Pseudonocardia hispaniensis]
DVGQLRRELTHAEAQTICEFAAIATEGLPPPEAADAWFEALTRIVPYVGLSLSVYCPLTGRHRTIASRGYSQKLLDFLDGSYLAQDPGYHWMLRSGKKHFNWLTPDFDYGTSPSAVDWFRPAGYSGGSTNHLHSRQGRYVANLHISSEDPRWPTPRSLSVIDLMAPMLCAAVDDLVAPRRLLDEQPAGTCGVLMSPTGIVAIPGRPECQLLSTEALLRHIRLRLPAGNHAIASAARWRWRDGAGVWHLVYTAPAAKGWLVMHRPEPLPYQLTPRELDVLTFLETGATNQWIGRRLGISMKTVARHVENMMAKLEVASRVSLATAARTFGLLRIDLHAVSGSSILSPE